ncbi:TonB-dependent siderophore receptor [Solimonas soli]|uniref:TonB-dependent siderophore receptor n=1 Tax=Solimonas soli TaxID=413479 RepID=UPI0004BCA356|nr:TonB-dependent siderophore receptor [Solimonas soli]
MRPFRLVCLLLSAALLAPAAAYAQAAAHLDLPAQPLDQAINALAQKTGIQIVFPTDLAAGRSAPALSGEFTPREALERLLAGSGLAVEQQPDGTWLIVRPPSEGATLMQAVHVTADAPPDDVTEGTASYTVRSASTSTRLPLSPRETPQSVSVITRQQIEDRNFVTLDDAMEVATGITSSTANANTVSYTARGFSMTSNLVDGMPALGNAYSGYVPNLAFYDRVEVLRGSAGLVYSTGSAGGTVNLVRKRPAVEPQVSVSLRRGRWNNNYAEIDVGRALNASGSLRGRAVMTYEDRETFIDLEDSRRPSGYGIVELDLSESTTLNAGGSIERYDGNIAINGLPRYSDGRDLGLPRSSRGMAPAWNRYYTDVDTLFVGLDQRFGERWSLRLNADFQNRVQGGAMTSTMMAVDPLTQRVPAYGALFYLRRSPAKVSAYDLMLNGRFDLLGRTHELVLGGTRSEFVNQRERSATAASSPITQTIFEFDPWSVPSPAFGPLTLGNTESSSIDQAVYGTARWSLTDSWKLITGLRLSTAISESKDHAAHTKTKDEDKNQLTPFAGLVADLSEHWSAYASYAEIFRVQNTQYTASGDPLKPAVGINYEAGAKGEFYDGRLNTSFAAFRIDEENRSQLDPDNLQPCAGSPTGGDCYLAQGKVRAQGLETELSGEMLPGLNAVAGYTYVKTKYLRDRTRTGEPSSNEGKPFRSTTPEHLFKLWATYRLPGAWNAWNIGGGVNAQSDIYNLSGTNRITQGGYSIWSARLGYQVDPHWNLSLNVNNVTDKTYYQRLGTLTNGNRYGEPRNWIVTVRGKF